MVETETIDKLFLELSQVTKASTAKELQLRAKLKSLVEAGKLKRNVIINNEFGFDGRWIAVPEEDFDDLQKALKAAKE